MIVLALHLKHGVESAFQTLGVKTRLYQSIIHKAAYFFSFAIPALFAIIPIYIFWKQL
jgi:succinate dehydrogenase / fumarate reductase cytochrome b subunit